MPPSIHPSLQAQQVILMHPQAPAKPPMGAACNGCGICCLAEPCPLGVLISRRRTGPCKALLWVPAERQYRCGALGTGLQARVVGRWIAAGSGCDCNLQAQACATIARPGLHPPTMDIRDD